MTLANPLPELRAVSSSPSLQISLIPVLIQVLNSSSLLSLPYVCCLHNQVHCQEWIPFLYLFYLTVYAPSCVPFQGCFSTSENTLTSLDCVQSYKFPVHQGLGTMCWRQGDAEMPQIPLADTRKYQYPYKGFRACWNVIFFRATNGLSWIVLIKNGSTDYAESLAQKLEECFC